MNGFSVLFETTKWKDYDQSINHTYLIKDNKMYAYMPRGKCKKVYLPKPILFDKRNRTFSKLGGFPFDLNLVVQ